jgi:exopolyphosphatase/guanosine-5'-triphosphate,3'-diphosphate pyrophosphatase
VPKAPAGETVAVIDIGSNSGRVVVYRLHRDGYLRILATSRASLRLVRELDERHSLSREAEARALDALQDFRALSLGAGARRTVALATAAVRDASNGPAFIRRVRTELGIRVRILTGDEEAEYGFLGAVRGLPVTDGVLFDLGGGSMQVSRFQGRRLVKDWSFPLGALRLSDAFLHSDPPAGREMRRLQEHVRRTLESAGIGRLGRGQSLVGTGGTVRNLAKIDQKSQSYPIPRLHGYVLSRERLAAIAALLAATRQRKRQGVPGLNDDRADSVAGGALAIQTLVEVLDGPEIHISGQGVREGMAYSLTSRRLPSTEASRETSVSALATSFSEWDPQAARRRAGLVQALLRALEPDADPELGEALVHGARLLDIGRSIDYFERHAHVADIVLATDLVGFSHRSVALLSAVVRSAGDGDSTAATYAPLLTRHDREAIERAGVILALADDIGERCRRGRPISLRCRVGRRDVRIAVSGLEGWRPRRIGERFEGAFGRSLHVVPGRASGKGK